MEKERARERQGVSQQAVDGSLVSFHCWSAHIEDTLGNPVDETRRHRRRQPQLQQPDVPRRPQMAVSPRRSLFQRRVVGQSGEDEQGGGRGVRVGGWTEGQSV